MVERTYMTSCGIIHYWVDKIAEQNKPQLVFLPGLTADHRLFDKQVDHFAGQYPVLVWDAPGHSSSWPFTFDFSLMDKAKWLDGIMFQEGFDKPVIIGQSMGGYVGQAYAQLFRRNCMGLFQSIPHRYNVNMLLPPKYGCLREWSQYIVITHGDLF